MSKFRSSLSLAASAVVKIESEQSEMREHDPHAAQANYDAHTVMLVRDALCSLGWTTQEFAEELEKRTTLRWAHFSGLTTHIED